ncbi:MAG: hypothetical protein CSYNP_04150 [Syntrophus sp. SKADARSKE-3]|nr:hypothetical protein [Syntrophus sp. SKADARSKE-3]
MFRKFILGGMVLVMGLLWVFGLQDLYAKDENVKPTLAKGTVANMNPKALCKKVALLIRNGTIDKYVLESKDIPDRGRASEYPNIDLDNDGKMDKIIVDSGEAGSFLDVRLSSGGGYDIEDGFMMLVGFDKQIYALVTYWEWKRNKDDSKDGHIIGHRLYQLTKHKAEIICDNF